jgi:uncharacterized membrane protein YkoI
MWLWLRPATLSALTVVTIMGAALTPASADDDDAKRARQAVEKGEIRHLSDILGMIRGKLPGDVIGVEIEHDDGRWVYEFKVIDGQGRLFEVNVNAQTGEIERIKEK